MGDTKVFQDIGKRRCELEIKREFEQYVSVLNLKAVSEKQKIVLLLNWAGPQAIKLYYSFHFENEVEKNKFVVIEKLENYCELKRNENLCKQLQKQQKIMLEDSNNISRANKESKNRSGEMLNRQSFATFEAVTQLEIPRFGKEDQSAQAHLKKHALPKLDISDMCS
ncbi:hypothetical protein scyTo_0000330 [Scyliorhinus torazame]|uniref:Uncharacterized protein n=1 Tax=Scyliorhinus torazame TaxID=75743 RepID=A0A401NVD0_SCYTO|nr:hypothetical protein [Scyliorhinus torazame]